MLTGGSTEVPVGSIIVDLFVRGADVARSRECSRAVRGRGRGRISREIYVAFMRKTRQGDRKERLVGSHLPESHVGGKQRQAKSNALWERDGEKEREREMKTDAILSYIGDIRFRGRVITSTLARYSPTRYRTGSRPTTNARGKEHTQDDAGHLRNCLSFAM